MTVPDGSFSDGVMHLTLIKEGISKAQLAKLFTETETGGHLKSEFVEYIRIKAFRLEPLDEPVNGGRREEKAMMVDGERVPYGPIQGEIIPGLANVLAL
jgi:sphingosine kinase